MCQEQVIKKLISEADIDKDGKISFEDYMGMMKQYMDEIEQSTKTSKKV